MDFIANSFFNAFLNWLQQIMLGLVNLIVEFVNSLTLDFWDNSYIRLILDFGFWIGTGVFAITFIVVLVDIAEEKSTGNPVHWAAVFTNIVKSFCFLVFSRWIALWSMQMVSTLTSFFGRELSAQAMTDSLQQTILQMTVPAALNLLLGIIFNIVVMVASIIFIVQSFKRFGTMFLHVMQAPLYVPDILRGDTAKMGEWLRQMIAISVTYGFQYLFFYLGSILMLETHVLVAIPFWLTMGQIPKILNRYGWSSASTGRFGQLAQSGLSLVMMK